MSRGEGGCLVEEEQFGISSGSHNRSFPALEIEKAYDPTLPTKLTPNLLAIVVQASPVPGERAASRSCDKRTKRRYAILFWHFV
jgi:hypothetical protein